MTNPGWNPFRERRTSCTIPTRCRYCGAKVYFYTDEFGSKVFFDELGPPWPIHSCTGYEKAYQDSWRCTSGPVGRFIRTENGELVHADEYLKHVQSERATGKKWDRPITAVHPRAGRSIYEIGVVRDIISKVNVFKKFNLKSDTRLCRQFLGDLAAESVTQVTLYADDATSGKLASYTFFVWQTTWHALGAVKEDLLYFKLEGKPIPGRFAYWMCTDIGYEI